LLSSIGARETGTTVSLAPPIFSREFFLKYFEENFLVLIIFIEAEVLLQKTS